MRDVKPRVFMRDKTSLPFQKQRFPSLDNDCDPVLRFLHSHNRLYLRLRDVEVWQRREA